MLLFPRGFPSRLAIGPRNLPLSSSRLCRGYDKALSWRSKVEQVIEPAMRIFTSPAVQLGLDLQYPPLGLEVDEFQLRIAGIHRRSSWHSNLLCHWPAGPLRPAAGFPGLRDGSSLPRLLRGLRPRRVRQPTASLPAAGLEARKGGRTRLVPTFTS